MELKEIWKDIEGYEGLYQVSNMGRVKSLGNNKTRKEKILKSSKNNRGYLCVNLYKDGLVKNYLIHRLVASAFIDNPNNLPQVNHKDENPKNNYGDNLEYCDSKYNMNYGTRTERVAKAKSIPILQFTLDGEFIRKWDSIADVEKELGFNHSSINMCCKGKYKNAYGYRWSYHYKSLWEKKHIPLVKQKKVA